MEQSFESELFRTVQNTLDFRGGVTEAVDDLCAEHGRDPQSDAVVAIVLTAMTDYERQRREANNETDI